MTDKLSRRSFLKAGVLTAGAVAGITKKSAAQDAGLKKDQRLATIIDTRKCIGCEECVYACRETNEAFYPNPEKPFPKMYPSRVKVEDWSDKQDVTDRLTPYNWLFIQQASYMDGDEEVIVNIPRRCMHCNNPPCVKLCPWGALKQEKNGLSRIDADLCLGGSKCNKVCPWDIPQRQTGVGLYLDLLPAFAGNGSMFKCSRCYQKIEKGQVPACIEVCPEGVQEIGPYETMLKKARNIAEVEKAYLYGDLENGGTSTFYISPVPFDTLNSSIEKGPGKPHLAPASNAMASGTILAKAMLIAPVAGISAAVLKHLKSLEKK